MTSDSDIPVVDVRGIRDPHERGIAYGKAATQEIMHTLEFYQRLLPKMVGHPWQVLCEGVAGLLSAAEASVPDAVQHVRGIAAGCGVEFVDLFVVNSRSELMARAGVSTNECTAIGVDHILAQTWDWFTRQRNGCVIVQSDRFITLTEAGMPAKIGLNADGVGLTLNFMTTKWPPAAPGTPIHLLIADALDRCSTADETVSLLLGTDVACSATVGVADPSGNGCWFVELMPGSRHEAVAIKSPAVHTNHCIADRLEGSDVAGRVLNNSHRRFVRARSLLAAGAEVETVLTDTVDPASAIDIPVHPRARPSAQMGTVAAVVMDLAQRRMRVAPGRPSEVGFVQEVCMESSAS